MKAEESVARGKGDLRRSWMSLSRVPPVRLKCHFLFTTHPPCMVSHCGAAEGPVIAREHHVKRCTAKQCHHVCFVCNPPTTRTAERGCSQILARTCSPANLGGLPFLMSVKWGIRDAPLGSGLETLVDVSPHFKKKSGLALSRTVAMKAKNRWHEGRVISGEAG